MPKAHWPEDNKAALAETARKCLQEGRNYRAPQLVEWYINFWTLQGAREFNIVSYQTGNVTVKYTSDDGQPRLRYEDIVNQNQTELGKLLKMDLRPKVSRKRLALDAAAKAAMGQVILDELVPMQTIERIRLSLMQGLLCYGTMGVASWNDANVVSQHSGADISTVAPWNLVPIPGRPSRAEEANGLIYHRWVPLRWLKERRKDFDIPKNEMHLDLDCRWVQPGSKVIENDEAAGPHSGSDPAFASRQKDIPQPGGSGSSELEGEPWVEMLECWLHTPDRKVERYVVVLGKHVAYDAKYYKEQPENLPYMPIDVIRYGHTDSWWGRSYIGPLVPLNFETEQMLANLFKNVRELDMNGILAIPSTWGINKEDLKPTNKPKVIWFEPPLSADKGEIKQFQPANTGDFPGKTAAFGNQILDRLGRRSPMDMGQPMGRYDGGVALGMAYEAAGVPGIPVGESVNQGMSTVFSGILKDAKRLLKTDELYLTSIDDELAGIIIDEQSGMIKLADSSIPLPSDVIISIAEKNPRDTQGRKQEVLTLFKMQLLSPQDFWWINYKESLGFLPGLDATEYIDAVLAAKYRNLVQWNNGRQPRGVVPSAHMDHRVELKVISAFMKRALFSLGSPEVREAFEVRKQFHEKGMAGFPDGLPSPDELMNAQEMKESNWGPTSPQGPLPPQLTQQ